MIIYYFGISLATNCGFICIQQHFPINMHSQTVISKD